MHTHINTQIVTDLQKSCDKAVHKLLTSLPFLFQVVGGSLEQIVK